MRDLLLSGNLSSSSPSAPRGHPARATRAPRLLSPPTPGMGKGQCGAGLCTLTPGSSPSCASYRLYDSGNPHHPEDGVGEWQRNAGELEQSRAGTELTLDQQVSTSPEGSPTLCWSCGKGRLQAPEHLLSSIKTLSEPGTPHPEGCFRAWLGVVYPWHTAARPMDPVPQHSRDIGLSPLAGQGPCDSASCTFHRVDTQDTSGSAKPENDTPFLRLGILHVRTSLHNVCTSLSGYVDRSFPHKAEPCTSLSLHVVNC